jgi:SNF2 family DNA or RNA helicase
MVVPKGHKGATPGGQVQNMKKYATDHDGHVKVVFTDDAGNKNSTIKAKVKARVKIRAKVKAKAKIKSKLATTGGDPAILSGEGIDDEGYAIIEFADYPDEEKEEIQEIYEQLYDGKDDFSIPPEHIALVDSKKLTKEALLGMDYAEVLRLATYKPAANVIEKFLGVRGVYLKNQHLGTDGEYHDTLVKPHQVKTLTWMRAREENSIAGTLGKSQVPGLGPGPSGKTITKGAWGVRGGIASLTMGLGKTLCALIHILSSKKSEFPSLIVCTKTVMINWHHDGLEKFFGTGENAPKVLYLHKDFMSVKEIAVIDRATILKYDIVITSYDACMTACKKKKYHEQCFEMGDDHTLMKGKIVSVHERRLEQANLPKVKGIEVIYGTPWERVVCDESQKYANPDTMTYKCMMAIYGKYKWCLTGTPIRNYDTDIWAQLRFCGYTGVTQKNEWKKKGIKMFQEHNLIDAIFTMDYKDAGEKLPPKTKYLVNVKLKGRQLEAYNFVLGAARNAYDKMMQNLCTFSCVLAMFTRLRQCAIAPYLITAESKREKAKGKAAKGDKEALDIIKSMMKDRKANNDLGLWCHDRDGEAGIYSAKMTSLVETIRKVPKDTKALVFSMFTSCLDLLAYALEVRLPDFEIVQIDGDTVGDERRSLLDQFNRSKTTRGAFFTYKVGGEGLNLTVATHCIPVEPWWTPAVAAQAEARCWRIGQTKPVHIHNIIVEDTIENRIIEICNEKEAMAASYLEGTSKTVGKIGLDKYTIGKMLGIRR